MSKTYVYLGPTIRGIVQNGTIYGETVKEELTEAIREYPEIEKLIVPADEIASVKQKINNGVNLYSIAYRKLLE